MTTLDKSFLLHSLNKSVI